MPNINFYPFNSAIEQFAPPPKPASKYVPEWYKDQSSLADMPKHESLMQGFVGATIKKCMPVFDSMTAGYILGCPCDIYVDATNPEKLEWSVPRDLKMYQSDLFSMHTPEQYQEYPIDKSLYHKQILRVLSTWSVQTDKGYSTLFQQPFHSDNSPLWAFSGIVDTDAFVTDGHFSFLVKKGFKGTIRQGTPLVQIIPFKREAWESTVMTSDDSEPILKRQRLDLRSTFIHAYKTKYRAKKEYR